MKQVIIFSLFFCFIGLNLFCQEKEVLPVSDVEVIKLFEANLANAKRVSNQIEMVPKPISKQIFDYNLRLEPLDINYPDPKIRPLSYAAEEIEDPYQFWIKAGYGNLKRPFVDMAYGIHLEDLYGLSIFAHYDGAEEVINENNRYYDDFEIKFNSWLLALDNFKIYSEISFVRENRNVLNTSSSGIIDDQELKYNSFGINTGIKTATPINDRWELEGSIFLRPSSIEHQNKYSELFFAIPLEATAHINSNSVVKINNQFEGSNSKYFENEILNYLEAAFIGSGNEFSYRLGLSLISSQERNSIFPEVRLKYEIEEIKSSFELGAHQKYIRNNFNRAYNVAPFISGNNINNSISSNQEIYLSTNTHYNIFRFGLKGGYQILENLLTFENGISNETYLLDGIYTNGNAVFLNANFEIIQSKELNFKVNFTKLFYNLNKDFGLEDLLVESSISYQKEKYGIQLKSMYINKALAISTDGMLTDELNALIDLSFEADYFFTKNFGVYAQGNNLLNKHYLRWLNYPNQGINVLAGVKIKF